MNDDEREVEADDDELVVLLGMLDEHLCPQCGTSDLLPSEDHPGEDECPWCKYVTSRTSGAVVAPAATINEGDVP